jgi:hypothetical protein
VLGSNLGQITAYPDWSVSLMFFVVLFSGYRQIRGDYLDLAKAASFQILSHASTPVI